ncbi:hypothetical protein CEXT_653191 [Caerostris extrusa]|uniref:Uncharacterized protein n=1 Tax=Caerostris extrusa TaxID=172846 RepID=A0AAV4WEJ9_CAEEX|nr:hypothetical protein CEXT_653191 [Caerostris extrusa]
MCIVGIQENIPFRALGDGSALKSGFLQRMHSQSSWQEQSPSAAPVNRSQGGIHVEDPLLIKSPPNLSSLADFEILDSPLRFSLKPGLFSLRPGRFL